VINIWDFVRKKIRFEYLERWRQRRETLAAAVQPRPFVSFSSTGRFLSLDLQ
jgi:hypothetical protein